MRLGRPGVQADQDANEHCQAHANRSADDLGDEPANNP
jgi:hypothetical protein